METHNKQGTAYVSIDAAMEALGETIAVQAGYIQMSDAFRAQMLRRLQERIALRLVHERPTHERGHERHQAHDTIDQELDRTTYLLYVFK